MITVSMMSYVLLFSSMLLAVVGQVLIKKGIVASSLNPDLFSIIRTLFTPLVFTGFVVYGVGSIVWLFVLQKLPLSVAYPTAGISYAVVLIFSVIFLHESISPFKVLAIGIIIFGVILLASQR